MSCPGDRETVARLPRCTCGESPERRFICLKSLQLGRPSPIRGRADPPVPDHIALEPVLPAYRVGHDHDRVGVERPDCVVDRLRGIGISDLALHAQPLMRASCEGAREELLGRLAPECLVVEPELQPRRQGRREHEHLGPFARPLANLGKERITGARLIRHDQ